jgi:uncharacterized membrane protein YoaT (DUF817 family)
MEPAAMSHSRPLYVQFAQEIAAFALLQGSIVLLYQHNLLLLLVLCTEAVAVLRWWHQAHDLASFVVIAVMGSLAEVIFVHVGVWSYANPTFLGLPLWFSVSFGLAGLIGQRLVRTLLGLWEYIIATR